MLHKRGAAYSQDLRERVLAKAAEGITVGAIAKALHVTPSWVSKVLGRLRATGERTARPQRCHVPPKLAPLYDDIRRQVEKRPDMTLAELRAWLREAYRISVSDGLMTKTLKLLGLTFKLKTYGPPRCKQLCRSDRASLRQRIRPNGIAAAKMELRAFRSLIKITASKSRHQLRHFLNQVSETPVRLLGHLASTTRKLPASSPQSSMRERTGSTYALAALSAAAKIPPLRNTAQAMRASLFASATTAVFLCALASSARSHWPNYYFACYRPHVPG